MPTWLAIYLLIGAVIGTLVDVALYAGLASLSEASWTFWLACVVAFVFYTVTWLPCLLIALVACAIDGGEFF